MAIKLFKYSRSKSYFNIAKRNLLVLFFVALTIQDSLQQQPWSKISPNTNMYSRHPYDQYKRDDTDVDDTTEMKWPIIDTIVDSDTKTYGWYQHQDFKPWHQLTPQASIHHKPVNHKGKAPLECPGTMLAIHLTKDLGKKFLDISPTHSRSQGLFCHTSFHLACLNYMHRKKKDGTCLLVFTCNQCKKIVYYFPQELNVKEENRLTMFYLWSTAINGIKTKERPHYRIVGSH